MCVGGVFRIPSVFLRRPYPGSVAIINEQIRFGHLQGAQPLLFQSRQIYHSTSIKLEKVASMESDESYKAFAIDPRSCTDPDDAFAVNLFTVSEELS
jgi:hypothetical protein